MVSKIGYSAEYVNTLPPAERKLIMFYYNEEQKEQKNRERQQRESQGGFSPGATIGSPIDTMM